MTLKSYAEGGWYFYRIGDVVFFRLNTILNNMTAGKIYTNSSIHAGFRPSTTIFLTGTFINNITVGGHFAAELNANGAVNIMPASSHTINMSYVLSGCYFTSDS